MGSTVAVAAEPNHPPGFRDSVGWILSAESNAGADLSVDGKERHVATRLCLMGRNAVDPRTSYQKTSLLQYSLLGGGGPRTERLVETAERLGFGRVKPLRSDGQFKQLGACQGVKCHPNSWGEREDHLSNCLAGLDFGPSMCIDVQKSHVKEAIFPLTNHTEVILSCGPNAPPVCSAGITATTPASTITQLINLISGLQALWIAPAPLAPCQTRGFSTFSAMAVLINETCFALRGAGTVFRARNLDVLGLSTKNMEIFTHQRAGNVWIS